MKTKRIRRNNCSRKEIRRWTSYTLSSHKQRGYEIQIDLDEMYAKALLSFNCTICNCELDWNKGKEKFQENSPTLDRVDNENVLRLDNIQIICHRCNRMKGTMALAEFIGYCEKVYKRFLYKYS